MATSHFVYDEPDSRQLCQGDVLQRTPDLVRLLNKYFPYYGAHQRYVHFMVLTQSCDLVRRDGKTCPASYITVAAIRPIADILLAEADRIQVERLKGTRVLGTKARDKLTMFLESLMDNNKAGFFYLHTDVNVGISEPCCAVLQLAVSLRAEHYETCLAAKSAQLKEPFQAKLGWLLGSMYSRVATTEWNDEKPAEKVAGEAARVLKSTFVTCDDEQVKTALADLDGADGADLLSPAELAKRIQSTKVVPKITKFKERAIQKLEAMKVFEPVKGRILYALRKDEQLLHDVGELLSNTEISGEDGPSATAPSVSEVATAIIRMVSDRVRAYSADAEDAARTKQIKDTVTELMTDNVLKSLVK